MTNSAGLNEGGVLCIMKQGDLNYLFFKKNFGIRALLVHMRWLKRSTLEIVLGKGYLTSQAMHPVIKMEFFVFASVVWVDYLLFFHTKYIFFTRLQFVILLKT